MSVIAKIFVVLNLVLAVVFLGSAATFLGEKETWRLKYEKETADLGQKIADLNINLQQANANYSDQRGLAEQFRNENTELKTQLEAKEAEVGDIRENHNQLLGQFERLSGTANDLQRTIDQLNEDKNRLIDEKDSAFAERRAAVEEKNDATAEQQRLERQILDLQDQMAEVEKNMNDVSQKLADTELVVAAYEDKFGKLGDVIGVPLIKGAVMAVNSELNIVLLSVGRDDKVQPGYEFTIYRGSEYIATVVIDKVEKDHCSGYSKKEIQRMDIEKGDQATTRL
jgi:DNA repair exonuclease SbcCD ATPase subunit